MTARQYRRGNYGELLAEEYAYARSQGKRMVYCDKDKNIIQTQIDCRKDPRPPGTTFDGAKMHYFMRVTGAIGMHEGYLPGYPASHGCIRLPGHMAEKFYHACSMGTPVIVVP